MQKLTQPGRQRGNSSTAARLPGIELAFHYQPHSSFKRWMWNAKKYTCSLWSRKELWLFCKESWSWLLSSLIRVTRSSRTSLIIMSILSYLTHSIHHRGPVFWDKLLLLPNPKTCKRLHKTSQGPRGRQEQDEQTRYSGVTLAVLSVTIRAIVGVTGRK